MDNLKSLNTSNVFHSLHHLEGRAGTEKKWKMNLNVNVNNISLDTMLSITEFRSLGTEEKQQTVMRLVPLFKPYICSIVDKLCGLDYNIGEANSHLDVIDRPPQYSRIQGGSLQKRLRLSLAFSQSNIFIRFLLYSPSLTPIVIDVKI